MKNTLLFTFIFVLFGCQTVRVEKRLHGRGYTLFWKKNISTQKNEAETVKLQTTEKQLNAPIVSETEKPTDVLHRDMAHSELTSSAPEIHGNETSYDLQSIPRLEVHAAEHEISGHEYKDKPQNTRSLSSGEDNSNWLLLSFTFPFLVPLLSRKKKQEHFQHWAKNNIGKARWGIVGLTFLAGVISFFLGDLFSAHALPELVPFSLTALCGASAVYTASNNRNIKTKALIVVTASSSLLLFAAGMNDDTVYIEDTTILPWWAIVLLMIVNVAVVAAVAFLAAVLSCHITCTTGQVFLSILVGVGGWYLALFLGFWIGLNLFRRQSQRDVNFAGKAALWALLGMGVLAAFSFISMVLSN